MPKTFTIKPATPEDVPVILNFIRELADYEKLAHEVIATEEILTKNIFGTNPHARVVIGYYAQQPRVCRDARERFTPSLVQIDSHCATAN